MKKPETIPEVTQTVPVGKLDEKAQKDARYKWEMFRETVYVYHDGPPNAGRDICSVNGPMPGDTRPWMVIEFEEGA